MGKEDGIRIGAGQNFFYCFAWVVCLSLHCTLPGGWFFYITILTMIIRPCTHFDCDASAMPRSFDTVKKNKRAELGTELG